MLLQSHLAPKGNTVGQINNCKDRKTTHGQKDEDVPFRLCRVNLEDGGDCGVEIIRFGLRRIMNIDRIAATRNCQSNVEWFKAPQG